MALKLYYDLGSQPSRAVFMFLKLNNIPFDEVFVSIGAGKNLTLGSMFQSFYILTHTINLWKVGS